MFESWANLGIDDLTDEDFEFPIPSPACGNISKKTSYQNSQSKQKRKNFDSSQNHPYFIHEESESSSSSPAAAPTSNNRQCGKLSFGIDSRVDPIDSLDREYGLNESCLSSPSYSPRGSLSPGNQPPMPRRFSQHQPARHASPNSSQMNPLSHSNSVFSDDENDDDIFQSSLHLLGNANNENLMVNEDLPQPKFATPTRANNDRSQHSHLRKINEINRPRDRILSTDKKKRKFPGPAGSLPKIKSGQTFSDVIHKIEDLNSNSTQSLKPECPISQESFSSQSTSSQFQNETWLCAKSDLQSEIWSFCEKYSIKNIKEKMHGGQLPRSKVPLMCSLLQNVELLPTDASAILMDESDSIRCSIHRDVICEFKELVKPGAVFLLKQVSLFSPTGKTLYLNMVLQNVVQLYSTSDSSESSGPVIRCRNTTNSFNMDTVLRLERSCLKPLSPPKSVTVSKLPNLPNPSNNFNSESPASSRIPVSRLWSAPSFTTPRSYNPLKQVFDSLQNSVLTETPSSRCKLHDDDWLNDDMDEIMSSLSEDQF